MKVFVFDLLAYDANLDHLKNGEPELPYPLAGRYFDAATAIRTYKAAVAVPRPTINAVLVTIAAGRQS